MIKWWLPFVSLLLLVVGVLAPAALLFASYQYSYQITVFNNSTVDYTNLTILIPVNNSQLAAYGYISATGLDTAVQEGATAVESSVVSSKLGVFFPTLLEAQTRTLTYRLGESPARSNFSVITGVGGNVTVADNATLEIGGNGSLLLEGAYLDVAAVNGSVVLKQDALQVYIPVVGNVTARMVKSVASNETLIPNGAGNLTQLSKTGATNWESIVANPIDGETTSVFKTNVGWMIDTYAAGNSSVGAGYIGRVTVGINASAFSGSVANGAARVVVVTNDHYYANAGWTLPNLYGAWSWNWYFYGWDTNPYTGLSWTWDEVRDMLIGLELQGNTDGTKAYCTYMSCNVTYYPYVEASVFSVASGEKDIKVSISSNSTYWALQLNGDTSWDNVHSSRALTGSNLIVNGEYETDTTGWTVGGAGATQAATAAKHKYGAKSLILTRNGIDCYTTQEIAGGGDLDGRTITVGTWAWADHAAQAQLVVSTDTQWLNDAPTQLHSGSGDWEYLYRTFAVAAGTTVVKVWLYNANTDGGDYFDGVVCYDEAGGAGVLNSTGSYVVGGNNTLAYWGGFKISINGTQQVWYEPNTMISGSVLTDRAGGDHNGTINWGTNPAGITITYGGLTSYTSTTSSAGGEEGSVPDLLDPIPSTEQVPNPEADELTSMPLFISFNSTANSLGMPVRALYVIAMFMTCMVLGVGGFIAIGSGWGFVGGYGAGSALALGTPVWPQMLVISVGFIFVLGLFLWRHQ